MVGRNWEWVNGILDDNRQGNNSERRACHSSRSPAVSSRADSACIGTLASLVAAYAVGRWEERLARSDFEGVAEAQAILIQNGVNEYVSRLAALRTRFESANEDITRNEYQTFSGRLFENHPGVMRVVWLPRVERKERGRVRGGGDRRRMFRHTGSSR